MGTISIIILINGITIFVVGNHCSVGVSKGFPTSNSHLLGLVLKRKKDLIKQMEIKYWHEIEADLENVAYCERGQEGD